MSLINPKVVNFISGTLLPVSGKSSLTDRLKVVRTILPVALLILLFVGLVPDGYAQSNKSKDKLGMVRVKSEGFTRKKQRQSSSFTGQGYDKGGAQGVQRSNQKQASNFIGTTVKIPKTSNNRTANPANASAYKKIRTPKQGRNPMGEQIIRQSQAYKGSGLVKSDYKKRKDARRKNKQIGSYKGNLVKSGYRKRIEARNKSKQISKYRGDLIVTKRPKGAHPSAVYRGGKVKNSYQQKENYRKRMMKRIGRNRNSQQPNYLRKKNRIEKPTYDSRESEIWNKPR